MIEIGGIVSASIVHKDDYKKFSIKDVLELSDCEWIESATDWRNQVLVFVDLKLDDEPITPDNHRSSQSDENDEE